jgi:hypothetical protein
MWRNQVMTNRSWCRGRICVDLGRLLAVLDIGSCWSAGIAAKGDQQVYPLSSVNLLVYGVAIS